MDESTGVLFSYVDLEARVRPDHPLRAIRAIANAALTVLQGEFAAMYAPRLGRLWIPPEKLLRAMLLQAFYSPLGLERQLMERLKYDLLFRWFVGLGVDDPVWDHSIFSKNRDRLLDGAIAAQFLAAVLAQPRMKKLRFSDRFSVDGTLIEAWASLQSFTLRAPRSGVRLDQDGGRAGEDEVPGPRPGRPGLRLQRGRLQPGAPAKAHGGDRLRAKGAAVAKAFAGRLRGVEMDVWESDFLALVAEAHLTVRGAADGAIALGALAGQLDVRYGTREGSALKEEKASGLKDPKGFVGPKVHSDFQVDDLAETQRRIEARGRNVLRRSRRRAKGQFRTVQGL